MAGDAPFQDFPSYVERPSRKPRVFFLFLVLFLLVIGVFAGLYMLGRTSEEKKDSVASVPTPIVSPTEAVAPEEKASPSATPAPEKPLERSELSVVVLNGSGVKGAAGSISSALTKSGYTIKQVGNAAQFTYTGVTITITEEKRDYLPQLKEDIAAVDPDLVIETSISDDIASDAEVIVGK